MSVLNGPGRNGILAKIVATVIAALMDAAVLGAWTNNRELGVLTTKIESMEKSLDRILGFFAPNPR